mmetsp:Transcript_97782/g.282124  ORF Transcript_97782/g.282124 Transcript_97782/m.282124 type:complete len:454 (-) Transcript_97782:1257-2618(-)
MWSESALQRLVGFLQPGEGDGGRAAAVRHAAPLHDHLHRHRGCVEENVPCAVVDAILQAVGLQLPSGRREGRGAGDQRSAARVEGLQSAEERRGGIPGELQAPSLEHSLLHLRRAREQRLRRSWIQAGLLDKFPERRAHARGQLHRSGSIAPTHASAGAAHAAHTHAVADATAACRIASGAAVAAHGGHLAHGAANGAVAAHGARAAHAVTGHGARRRAHAALRVPEPAEDHGGGVPSVSEAASLDHRPLHRRARLQQSIGRPLVQLVFEDELPHKVASAHVGGSPPLRGAGALADQVDGVLQAAEQRRGWVPGLVEAPALHDVDLHSGRRLPQRIASAVVQAVLHDEGLDPHSERLAARGVAALRELLGLQLRHLERVHLHRVPEPACERGGRVPRVCHAPALDDRDLHSERGLTEGVARGLVDLVLHDECLHLLRHLLGVVLRDLRGRRHL